MRRVPTDGVRGVEALREAAASELGTVMNLVRAAVLAAWRQHPGYADNGYAYIESVFPDHAVVYDEKGRYWSFPYTIDDANQVVIGEKVEVLRNYTPVTLREAAAPANEPVGARVDAAAGVFIEALAADSSTPPRYLVRVIQGGTSLNGVNYPASVLREAAPLFNGVRVFVKSDADHINGAPGAKDFRQLVGRLVEARYVATGAGEIHAVLEVLETADVAAKLREAVERGMTDLFGLSIDATGTSKGKGKFREATKLTKVDSVDLIIEPGAGGQVIRFVEAKPQEHDMLREHMLKEIRARNATRADSLANATDEEVMTAYREALATNNNPESEAAASGGTGAAQSAPVTAAQVADQIRMVEARANARVMIAGARLPQASKDRINQRFAEAASFTDAEVTAAIEAEREYLGRVVEGAQVHGLGTVEAGQDQSEKVQDRLDAFFDRSKGASSFREAYVDITGDRKVTGELSNCDPRRMREALGEQRFAEAVSSSTFGDILGDSITRAMIREYGALEAYQDWRWLCDVVPVNDFREQKRTRMGGYGNLPAVVEDGPYAPLTTPTDEEATYAVTKRGGTETISLEAIANDDVGALRRIPQKLAVAAGRTLYEFVYNFLATNPVIYDTVALFHASHGNLGAAALANASFAAARLAMKRQTEKDSLKRLGITLRHLVIPSDLEEIAFDMFVRGTNNDETFVQSRKPTVHVVDYWTDANNWFATADNSQVPLIELGFYGSEEPSLFIQDTPNQGSLFSNDQIKYKIRHIYSGAVRDFRGLYGAIVA